MDYQERYDELDEIVSSLDRLVDEITDIYYIDALNELKFEAQNELEQVEEELRKEQWEEEREMNYEFERSRL